MLPDLTSHKHYISSFFFFLFSFSYLFNYFVFQAVVLLLICVKVVNGNCELLLQLLLKGKKTLRILSKNKKNDLSFDSDIFEFGFFSAYPHVSKTFIFPKFCFSSKEFPN